MKIPYEYFEDPEFHNQYHRVKSIRGSTIISPIKSVLDIMQYSISLLSYLYFLLYVHWSLVLVSLVAAIPMFLVQAKYGNKKFFLMRFQTPIAREATYLNSLICNRESNKEVRLFGLEDHFLKKWSYLFKENNSRMFKLIKKEKTANIYLDMSTSLLYGGAALIVVWLLKNNKLSIGDFVATGQAVQGAQRSINSISSNLARVYEQGLYIEDLYQFLQIEENDSGNKTAELQLPLEKGIRIENLYFNYPNSHQEILKKVSLNIAPGERVAIVGENGSGKSTLVKCLIGLYSNYRGSILYDNQDIKEFDRQSLYRNTSVIFQDFVKYAFTIKENITLGKIEEANDQEKLFSVGKKSGLEYLSERFKNGYDTRLGKAFSDSEDISGGQWQKVALARILFKDASIIVLDEPTSSLDPQSELETFNKFIELTQNKTTIFISHRMAAARMSDKIIVMSQGEIVETGTHNELMNHKKEYYKMYNMQAKWYEKDKTLSLV